MATLAVKKRYLSSYVYWKGRMTLIKLSSATIRTMTQFDKHRSPFPLTLFHIAILSANAENYRQPERTIIFIYSSIKANQIPTISFAIHPVIAQ